MLKRATPYINRKRVFRQEKNTSLPEKHVTGQEGKLSQENMGRGQHAHRAQEKETRGR